MRRMTVLRMAFLPAAGGVLGMVFTGAATPASAASFDGSLVPDPSPSIVPGAIPVSPDGSIPYTVTVIDATRGPIPGAHVEIQFSPEADALITWGLLQAHSVIDGITDYQGKFSFYIAGAGCLDANRYSFPTYVAQVRADGIVLGEPGVVNSPDAVTSQGLLPTDLGEPTCESGWMQVGLSDAVFHGLSISQGLNEPCSDFTIPLGDGVSLSDALILGPHISQGVTRPCQE